MRIYEVYEKVKVGVIFDKQKVVPKWFVWGKDKHQVTKIEQIWRTKEGEAPLLFFMVNDGSNAYEIRFNQKSLDWELEKVYMEA